MLRDSVNISKEKATEFIKLWDNWFSTVNEDEKEKYLDAVQNFIARKRGDYKHKKILLESFKKTPITYSERENNKIYHETISFIKEEGFLPFVKANFPNLEEKIHYLESSEGYEDFKKMSYIDNFDSKFYMEFTRVFTAYHKYCDNGHRMEKEINAWNIASRYLDEFSKEEIAAICFKHLTPEEKKQQKENIEEKIRDLSNEINDLSVKLDKFKAYEKVFNGEEKGN